MAERVAGLHSRKERESFAKWFLYRLLQCALLVELEAGKEDPLLALLNRAERRRKSLYREILLPIFQGRPGGKGVFPHWKLFSDFQGEDFRRTAQEAVLDNPSLRGLLEEDGFFWGNFSFTLGEVAGTIGPSALEWVYEEGLSREERGRGGVFFTPPAVVRFMCRESLLEYLAAWGGFSRNHLADLIEERPEGRFSRGERKRLSGLLNEITVLDPACGGGAFLVGMLRELERFHRAAGGSFGSIPPRSQIVMRNLFGMDTSQESLQVAKDRLAFAVWEKERGKGIPCRANLKLGNALLEENPWFEEGGGKTGFHVVLANPPYVDFKRASRLPYHRDLKRRFGWCNDLYVHFIFRAGEILRAGGIAALITPDSYFCQARTERLREHLQNRRLLTLMKAPPAFQATVETAILLFRNEKAGDHRFTFIEASGAGLEKLSRLKRPERFSLPSQEAFPVACASRDGARFYRVPVALYREGPFSNFFEPSRENMELYKRLMPGWAELLDRWWASICTTSRMERFRSSVEAYRRGLKPGDLTLLGLVTEGGQGMATGKNGDFLAWRQGSPEGERACQRVDAFRKKGMDFKKLGRFVWRTIPPGRIARVESLKEEERRNGISSSKPHWVPYEKGDREGNRWWRPCNLYIDWSRERVRWLQQMSGKKGRGMPVLRNIRFFFRRGFLWSDINTEFIKSRLVAPCVHDVAGMRLETGLQWLPDEFFSALLNTPFFNLRIRPFISQKQHLQMNQARSLPLILPSSERIDRIAGLVREAVNLQKKRFEREEAYRSGEIARSLMKIEEKINREMEDLYLP